MAITEQSIVIHSSQQAVYHIAQDYFIRPQWDTFSKTIEFLGGATEAQPGVRVSVHANNGLRMIVEYVAVKKPERAAIKMVSGPIFFQKFAGTWLFKKIDNDSTMVTFRYGYKSKWFLIPALFDYLIGFQFGRETKLRLNALKDYCEKQASRQNKNKKIGLTTNCVIA